MEEKDYKELLALREYKASVETTNKEVLDLLIAKAEEFDDEEITQAAYNLAGPRLVIREKIEKGHDLLKCDLRYILDTLSYNEKQD